MTTYAPGRLSIRLLGHFAVLLGDEVILDDSWRQSKAKAVLKLLALSPGHSLPRDHLTDLLWPELGAVAAAANLRKSIHRIRQRFTAAGMEPPFATAHPHVLALAEDFSIDVDEFRSYAERARASRVLSEYDRALAIYTGDLLPGDAWEEWGQRERQQLLELRSRLLVDAARILGVNGQRQHAIMRLEAAIERDRSNEEAHRLLMRLHAQAGDRERAIKQYNACVRALRSAADGKPSEETVSLYEQIRSGDVAGSMAGSPFVARQREMARLEGCVQDALGGRTRLALVAGDAGIGKTRLAEHVSDYAAFSGMRAVWGHSFGGEGCPAYWPWLQIIRECAILAEGRSRGRGGDGILQLVPGARGGGGRRGVDTRSSDDEARLRLFEAVAAYLLAASERQPLLIVLEDLHWADVPSLLLFGHLARRLRDARIVFLVTYRDGLPDCPERLSGIVNELAPLPRCDAISLRPFSADDAAAFVALNAGFEVPEELVAQLYQRTEGNAFFLRESLRSLLDEGLSPEWCQVAPEQVQTPGTVRGVIRQRMSALPAEYRHVLSIAAVIGREFGFELLSSASGVAANRLAPALDASVAHRLIEDVRGSPGRYRFTHVLIRETLYDDLPPGRRMAFHGVVGRSLESLTGGSSRLAELAHHFFEAAPLGFLPRAVAYARRAAFEAMRSLAFEEAVVHYQRALQLTDSDGSTAVEQCQIWLSLADAQRVIGQHNNARQSYLNAAALARKAGARDTLARAASGFMWISFPRNELRARPPGEPGDEPS